MRLIDADTLKHDIVNAPYRCIETTDGILNLIDEQSTVEIDEKLKKQQEEIARLNEGIDILRKKLEEVVFHDMKH